MNILHISDIHFRRNYEPYKDGYKGMLYHMQSPLIALKYCIERAKEKGVIDLLVISGDLTEDGEKEDYSFLKKQIEELIGDTQIVVTLGNHDRKDNFRTGWLHEKASNQPYNEIYQLDQLAVISFDSSIQGDPNGRIQKEQLQWLAHAFKQVGDKPVIFITHHHLLENQSTMYCAVDADLLLEQIQNTNTIAILNGHTHHHYMGTVGKKPYFTADGMSFCGEDEEGGLVRFEERYGYSLYQITDGKITKQEVETFITGKVLDIIKMN